jgi:hypothetical protein
MKTQEPFLSSTGNEKITKVVYESNPNYRGTEQREKSLKEIVSYEEPKIDFDLLKKRGSSKTFSGWLIGKIRESSQSRNLEMTILLQEIYKKHQEFNSKKEIITLEIIEGWKGKDKIEINKRFDNDFIIESHNKDKETGEITTSRHTIPKENVNNMLTFISYWQVGESHKCYDFATMLGVNDWKEVWKERMSIYFPLYYYPLKILESLGIIKYSGRGKITRIR